MVTFRCKPSRVRRQPSIDSIPLRCRGGRGESQGSPCANWAWPPAWPLAVRPAGSLEAPRARVGPEDPFCGERLERIFGCPCGWRGRPGQCAAFRPRAGDLSGDSRNSRVPDSLVLAAGRSTGRYGGGTARGRSPGPPGAAARRARWASAHRARRKLPPANGAAPDLTPAAYGGSSGRLSPIRLTRPLLAFTSQAVRPGAPQVRP